MIDKIKFIWIMLFIFILWLAGWMLWAFWAIWDVFVYGFKWLFTKRVRGFEDYRYRLRVRKKYFNVNKG